MVAPLHLTFEETGYRVDLTGQKLKVVKQVTDYGDITKQHTNYSWVFDVPKTPENIAQLQLLGLPGDASQMPYRKTPCFLTYNGTTIEPEGRFQIREDRQGSWRCFVQAGIIDFYRDISDDKISDILDLSALDHTNSVANIIASFNQDTYRYIIASYNGPPLADVGGITNLSPFALVPSVNLQFLWDAIMDYYGWTYQLPDGVDLSDRWMTYPNAIAYEQDSPITIATWSHPEEDIDIDPQYPYGTFLMPFDTRVDDPEWVEGVPVSTGHRMVMQQAGVGAFTFTFDGGLLFSSFLGGLWLVYCKLEIWHNGELVAQEVQSEPPTELTISVDRIFQDGDVIECRLQQNDQVPANGSSSFFLQGARITSASFDVDLLGQQDISFSRALLKVKVKDFFKEIMMRFALAAFPDPKQKEIEFKTMQERVEAEVVDWSARYVARKSEKYAIKGTAQKNYLRHKYNKDNEDHGDGIITTNNENLSDEKDLYKSFTYCQEDELATFTLTDGSRQFPILTMFDIEVEEDPDTGDLLANYEPLKDRFYILQDTQASGDIYILGNLAENPPLAITNGSTFNDIVDNWYAEHPQIYHEARVQEIELELSEYDLAILDLRKLYYFEQEGSYYLLQKLTFEPARLSTGTFIRVDYRPTLSQTRDPYT